MIGCYIFLDDQNPLTNQMRFFKNGKDQGIAYNGKELPSGVYFPAISLYMKVTKYVRINYISFVTIIFSLKNFSFIILL